MTSLLRRFSLLPIMAFVAIAYIVLHFFCANVFAQQSPLRLATTATLQPRWTALASQTVYLLTTTATQARGQNVMGILAATNKGLHQSLDTGQTWSSLGLPNDDVYDAVLLNGAIIAATDKGIQMRASSGAVSWQARTYPVSTGNATQATIQQRGLPTYTLHSVGASIYAGTTRGVYRSTDGGATWTTTGTVLASKTVRTVISLGSTLFAAVWNDGVYRSQDNGITWSLVDIVPGSTVERTFRSLSVYGSFIYAGSSEGNLYQSDNGTSWRRVVSTGNNGQNGVNARGIEALSRYGNTIIGAVYNGIAYSHDNGQTWKLMQVASRDIGTIVILPPKPVKVLVKWQQSGKKVLLRFNPTTHADRQPFLVVVVQAVLPLVVVREAVLEAGPVQVLAQVSADTICLVVTQSHRPLPLLHRRLFSNPHRLVSRFLSVFRQLLRSFALKWLRSTIPMRGLI